MYESVPLIRRTSPGKFVPLPLICHNNSWICFVSCLYSGLLRRRRRLPQLLICPQEFQWSSSLCACLENYFSGCLYLHEWGSSRTNTPPHNSHYNTNNYEVNGMCVCPGMFIRREGILFGAHCRRPKWIRLLGRAGQANNKLPNKSGKLELTSLW